MNNKTHLIIPVENIRNEIFTPPGGGKTYKRENFLEHGRLLIDKAIKVKNIQAVKKDMQFTSDYFIEMESPKEFPIKQAKGSIEKLGFEIIRYSKANENLATVKINKSLYSEFEGKMNEYTYNDTHPNKSYISPIEDLKDIPIEDKVDKEIDLDSNVEEEIIISLYNILSSKEKDLILQNIKEELNKSNIKSEIHTFINGLTAVVCKIAQQKIKSIFENYSTVRQISKNHLAIIEQSMPVQDLPNPLTVSAPVSDSKIGVIDSGIEHSLNIFNGLIYQRLPFLPLGTVNSPNDHGTFVASRCLFGDNIDNCLIDHKLNPYCKVIDIPIFGIDSSGVEIPASEIHLMLALQNIIPKLVHEVKIFNISLGFNKPIEDHSFSELAKFIDFLSKEFDILFIISSGNIHTQLGDFPQGHFSNNSSRINSPAESLLSISVGSLAKYESDVSLSKKNQLSPFSRVGPGADGGIKPELLSHGGNLATGYSVIPRLSTYGISKDGAKLSVDNGTSFSSPLISQYAQRLFDLYPNSDSNLIKALLFHFSNPIEKFDNCTIDSIFLSGFGEPDIDAALYAGEYNGVYIFEGELEVNVYQFIKFHIPSMLSSDYPDSKLKIKITLVYDPPTNPDNEIEYSCSRIAASLIKPTPEGDKIVNLTGDEKYNLPWNPIIKFEKSFSRNYLVGEWFLKLRLFTRHLNLSYYKQSYAVVIEVIDENNNTDVYNSILAEFGNIYSRIILKIAA